VNKQELLKVAKPISFNTEMVRAILDDRKTVTRRKIKNIPDNYEWIGWDSDGSATFGIADGCRILEAMRAKPKYQIGDVLQVIEVAIGKEIPLEIFLKVTNVKVERLKEITEEQAIKEGVRVIPQAHSGEIAYHNYMHGDKKSKYWLYKGSIYHYVIDSFVSLWNSILKLEDWDKYGWDANPWVFVYEFERIEVEE
jgi:hypothetical protein